MFAFFINNTPDNRMDHEVHKEGCFWLSIAKNTSYLGIFVSCGPAVVAAKRIHPTANGCAHCSPACHTS